MTIVGPRGVINMCSVRVGRGRGGSDVPFPRVIRARLG